MPKPTDFTTFATEHPNYFPGQFLLEDDFELQHKYLSDRQHYYNQILHVSGIVEGLEIEAIADKKAVKIKSGSAINNKGELIVVKQDISSFSDFKNLTTGELYIEYFEEKKVQQQEDFTRWQENPKVGFAPTSPKDSLKLAKLTIGDTVTIDVSIREYSGLSLPTSSNTALTLRSGGNANPNLAVLTGSLKVDGDLTVTGTISGKIDTTNISSGILNVDRIPSLSADKISSGILNVDRIPNLSANKINSGTITGNLTVSGNIALSDYGRQIQLIKATTAGGETAWGTIQANSYVGLQIGFPDSTFGGKLQIGTLGSTGDNKFNELILVTANGDTSIKGNLTVKGAIQPSAGDTESNGIMFPKDPGGGSGDAAWIRYSSRFPTSNFASEKEQMTLEIGILNDFNDHIALISSGGVGIGTKTPAAKLDVNGHIFEKLDVIACNNRDDWGSATHPIKDYFKGKLSGKPVGTMMRAIQDNPRWRGHYWQAWVDADGLVRVIHNYHNTPHLADRNT